MINQTSLDRHALAEGMDKLWIKLNSKAQHENLDVWEWVQGVALYGIIKAYEGTGQERFSGLLQKWSDDNAGKIRFGSVNWVAPANALHHAYGQTGNPAYLEHCREMAAWCLNGALRTSNGGYAHVWGPGAGGLEDYRNQLWIDTLFMAGLFMLRFGLFDGNPALIREALKQFDIHITCQFDTASGLFYHGYHCLEQIPLGQHWGRGNGWAAVSLVELLDLLQADSSQTERYAAVFRQLMDSAYRLQLPNGLLRTLLDVEEEGSYPETSGSALFAYAALKGQRLGLLDDTFADWGKRITQEILTYHLAADGTVLHASGGTDCQDKDGYLKVPYAPRQYTSGVVLMLLTEALEHTT